MASSGDTPKKVYEKKWVERSAGSTLAQSRRVEGAHAPFARGETGINEQVILHGKKPKTPGSGSGAIAEFLTEVAIAAAVIGAQAFIDKGIPAIKQRLADRRAAKIAAATTEEPDTVVAVVDAHDAVDDVGTEVSETGAEIDTQQWYQLFFEAVAHGAAGSAHQAISAERWAFLASAHVVDDEETQALASAMREITPEQLRDRLDRALEQHPELATEDPATVMRRLFGDDEDAVLLPLPVEGAGDTSGDGRQTFEIIESTVENDDDETDKA
ncbi:hypothetical protein ACNPM4_14790 [Microbacterium sp. AGC62]